MGLDVGINSKLEVKWREEIYKSVVQDANNKSLLISIPVVDSVYLVLKTGEEIELVYYDNRANVYNFKCKVINRITENNIPFYSISLPYDVVRIQRRNFVRVETVQLIKDIKKCEKELDMEVNYKLSNAILLDLSGGGMRIKLREQLNENDVIAANIVSENDILPVKGEIVRIDKTEDRRYIYGVSFCDLNNMTREKIIGIVFKIMRKQRELR
ncbi:MAG: flagellar brake protein [Clostridium sp.]